MKVPCFALNSKLRLQNQCFLPKLLSKNRAGFHDRLLQNAHAGFHAGWSRLACFGEAAGREEGRNSETKNGGKRQHAAPKPDSSGEDLLDTSLEPKLCMTL